MTDMLRTDTDPTPPHSSPETSSLPEAEHLSDASGDPAPTSEPAPPVGGAGHLLRQARQAQQKDLDTLAYMLKVPVEKLQALEDEDWQRLPDLVFARSLALGVCRHLRIPPQPVLDLLPQPPTKHLANQLGINEPVRYRTVPSILPQAAGVLGRRLGLLAVLLVAGGVLAYGAWQWQHRDAVAQDGGASASLGAPAEGAPPAADGQPLFAPGYTPADAPLEPEDRDPAASTPAAVAPAATPTTAPSLPQESATAPALPTVPPAAPPAATTPGSASAPEVSAASAPAAATSAASDVARGSAPALRLRATAQSWVQVRDGEGRLVMEKILRPDEVFETSARRPLSVVLGRADAIAVEVDGAAFDPQTKSRDNVARFEVK